MFALILRAPLRLRVVFFLFSGALLVPAPPRVAFSSFFFVAFTPFPLLRFVCRTCVEPRLTAHLPPPPFPSPPHSANPLPLPVPFLRDRPPLIRHLSVLCQRAEWPEKAIRRNERAQTCVCSRVRARVSCITTLKDRLCFFVSLSLPRVGPSARPDPAVNLHVHMHTHARTRAWPPFLFFFVSLSVTFFSFLSHVKPT